MILKPSEFAPTCALIFAEILTRGWRANGVFNLINGLGPEVGAAMSEHPDIDMISFIGSHVRGSTSRGGPLIRSSALEELVGKSPCIVLEGADYEKAVSKCIATLFQNSGQSCGAPSRLMVPKSRMAEIARIAKAIGERYSVGQRGGHPYGPRRTPQPRASTFAPPSLRMSQTK
ncbi:aldehyde dehydrogenase family protein [Bradyrhizobium sp. DASA03005]|uniref:aldehyde dehydrogenase family protein n=1 Tax=Bradyrhizobium sp. SPXBL-02 TaxID=3395912 RepID=UPI003F72A890